MVSWLIEMLTMRPQRCFIMCGTAARAIRNGPLTFVSIIIRQTAGSVSQNFVGVSKNFSLTKRMPPRVVDEDVHAAELAHRFAHHALAIFFARDVGQKLADRAGCGAFRGFLRDLIDFTAIARRCQHDVCSGARQAQRHGTAQAPAGSGDNRCLPRKCFAYRSSLFHLENPSGAGFSLWGFVARTSRPGATKTHRLKPAPQNSTINSDLRLHFHTRGLAQWASSSLTSAGGGF